MNIPTLIQGDNLNLSTAWLEIFEKVVDYSGKEISPLILTLTDFTENKIIKNELNLNLKRNNFNSIETVSETIFPNSLYEYFDYDRKKLYKSYIGSSKRIKKLDTRNAKGTYFERLISYGESHQVNQLEIIISSLQNSTIKRRSKLQASTFDPLRDHTNKMFQGFPCLQHVTFYKSESGGLIINSFYAVQYLYQKAYGNWLGLINLGKFIARESGLELERFNCFIGVEQLEITKTEAKRLLNKLKPDEGNEQG
ncbi:MAG: thymidylate synthase [Bacteroidetes bacterium]|nr:thymidylate synthase [Bacteroidota bacterium]